MRNKRIYLPIGSGVLYEGVFLRVKAQKYNNPRCSDCFFSEAVRKANGLSNISCFVHNFICTAHLRKDKRHVIFVKDP